MEKRVRENGFRQRHPILIRGGSRDLGDPWICLYQGREPRNAGPRDRAPLGAGDGAASLGADAVGHHLLDLAPREEHILVKVGVRGRGGSRVGVKVRANALM